LTRPATTATLLAELLSALFSVDEHVVRVSEPLFLRLTDFPHASRSRTCSSGSGETTLLSAVSTVVDRQFAEEPFAPITRLKVYRICHRPLYLEKHGSEGLAIDECGIEDQLGPLIGDLRLPPVFDLALHGLEVTLDSVHSDGKSINQIEALGVLGKHRREHA